MEEALRGILCLVSWALASGLIIYLNVKGAAELKAHVEENRLKQSRWGE